MLAAEGAGPEVTDAVAREIRRRDPATALAPAPALADGRTHIARAPSSDWSSRRQGFLVWVYASAGLMALGAFGPWVKVLGHSVGGTDGSNDGWLVVAAAALGALIFSLQRNSQRSGLWAVLGGIAGAGVTIYDRENVSSAIQSGGALAQALVQIGWGLNLAMIASISFAIAGVVWVAKADAQLT
jgi:hypothetical protein